MQTRIIQATRKRACVPKLFEKAKDILETLDKRPNYYKLGNFLKEKDFELKMLAGTFEGTEICLMQYKNGAGIARRFGTYMQNPGIVVLESGRGFVSIQDTHLNELATINFDVCRYKVDEIVNLSQPKENGYSFYAGNIEVGEVVLWAVMRYLNQ